MDLARGQKNHLSLAISTMKHELEADLERTLVSEAQISHRLAQLGREINDTYALGEVTVVAIINGALIFTADLIRHLTVPLRLDCIRVSSYLDETQPQTDPRIIDNIRLDLKDRHVLLIDDILDTGSTLNRVTKEIGQREPKSLRTCVLLDKKARRRVQIEADFVGFEIPDEFVVGYGLDFAERYRHLSCIGVLKPELQNPPDWK